MAYLTPAYYSFFEELAKNNESEWFKANKKRYEKDVKAPFLALVTDLLAALQKEDDRLVGQDPKKLVFRIYRDVRFSKDKTPYKLNSSAAFSPLGKSSGIVGLYFHVGLAGYAGAGSPSFVGGGAYGPDKDQLKAIRDEIVYRPKEWAKALKDKQFQKLYGGEIKGETLQRSPKGYEDLVDDHPYIKHKQWYYGADIPQEMAFADDLVERLVAYYNAGRPVMDFLLEAVGA